MIKIRRACNNYKRMRADLGRQMTILKAHAEFIHRELNLWEELIFENVARNDALESKTKRISELQGTIDSLKRQNKELQAEMIAKDGIIKKQTIMMEEAKPKEAKYIKSGNMYYCSNCEADFQHYELFNKYCPECGAHFTNSRKEQA